MNRFETMTLRVIVAFVLALVVASCSGSSTATPTITEPPTTSSTTTLPTTTTTAPTTSTSIDEEEAAIAAIEKAYARSGEVFYGCYETLPDCDADEAFKEVFTGETYSKLTSVAKERQEDILVFEAPDNPSWVQTEIRNIELASDLRSATAETCVVDAHQLFTVEADGSLIAVGLHDSAAVEWGRLEYVLEDDDVWRITNYVDGSLKSSQVPLTELDELLERGDPCSDLEPEV